MSIQTETSNEVVDAKERAAAIDCTESFIVQAPAGSGKTELLTQRYLNLLAHAVHQPEQVLAITFTKKAAAEMRLRIIESLEFAATETCPDAEPKRTNWTLAQAVLKKDEQSDWHLRANPNRLKIQTIDGFCSNLVGQMPIVSEHGGVPVLEPDCSHHYLAAATKTLMSLGSGVPWSNAIGVLLAHLNNDFDRVCLLFAGMLSKRDQWLSIVTGPSVQLKHDPLRLKEELELGLDNAITDHLLGCRLGLAKFLSKFQCEEAFFECVSFAASQLDVSEPLAKWLSLSNPKDLPPAEVTHQSLWKALSQWLLVADGSSFRKTVNKAQGFLAPSSVKDKTAQSQLKEIKQQMVELLSVFRSSTGSVLPQLAAIKNLPRAQYEEGQWEVLAALLELLPIAAAFLKVEFQQQGQVDFVEVSQGALRALDSNEFQDPHAAEAYKKSVDFDEVGPSDLALRLDNQIKHLLIDEFQDTSITQYQLVKHLLRGWEPGDGRTIFLVGDPMQSIYRFRQADVSLFLRVREAGIASVSPKSLVLKTNFRSEPHVVHWINQVFCHVFPDADEPEFGGIAYSASAAGRRSSVDGADHNECSSTVETYLDFDDEGSKQHVLDVVRRLREENPNDSIAVLVRARAHAAELTAELAQQGFGVNAIEMEALAKQTVIQDLVSVTRALLDLSDSIAWLSVLRAPWCGATTQDLLAVQSVQSGSTVLEKLQSFSQQKTHDAHPFSSDAVMQRLQQIADLFFVKLENKDRYSLRVLVQSTWAALNADRYCDEERLRQANNYFDLLQSLNKKGLVTPVTVMEAVEKLKADQISVGNNPIEVMTIHKSKGLEFDHVIIPRLDKGSQSDNAELLNWSRSTSINGNEEYLVVAPIDAKVDSIRNKSGNESVANYLKYVNKRRANYEIGRLFYVAATRAKRSLHCFAVIKGNEDKGVIASPTEGSFLFLLNKSPKLELADYFENFLTWHTNTAERNSADWDVENSMDTNNAVKQIVKRVAYEQLTGFISSDVTNESFNPLNATEPDESKENKANASGGIVMHRMLEQISHRMITDANYLNTFTLRESSVIDALIADGVTAEDAPQQAVTVAAAINNAVSDSRGCWILSPHKLGASEYSVQYQLPSKIKTLTIDRTFVENDVRWIVDYKLLHDTHASAEQLNKAVVQHTAQLEDYGAVLSLADTRVIMLALYFPLQKHWVEWKYDGASSE